MTLAQCKWRHKEYGTQPQETWVSIEWNGLPVLHCALLLIPPTHTHTHTPTPTHTHTYTHMYTSSQSSIYWERCYSLGQYPTLIMPRPPRILDPANPANNLYVSGVGSYSAYQHCGEYTVGDGDWSMLTRLIDSLDLSKPVNHWV